MQTIGERLEDARKKKGISIREAAEATKIRGDYLQKFESNHFDIGLTEIYTRGFLRAYATFLKLPSDRILNDYASLGRGDVRPRQPSREIYGRMDITVSSAGESSDRAAPPEEQSPEPAPAPAPARASSPRYPRRGGTSLPSGPDPAVMYQYLKIGGIVIALIVVVLIGKSMLSPKPAAPAHDSPTTATPVTSQPTTTVAPAAPVAGSYFTLVALDVVRVTVLHKIGETEGEEIFNGTLARGESKMIPWTSEVFIRASEGDNLKIEIKGTRYGTKFRGYGRCQLGAP